METMIDTAKLIGLVTKLNREFMDAANSDAADNACIDEVFAAPFSFNDDGINSSSILFMDRSVWDSELIPYTDIEEVEECVRQDVQDIIRVWHKAVTIKK